MSYDEVPLVSRIPNVPARGLSVGANLLTVVLVFSMVGVGAWWLQKYVNDQPPIVIEWQADDYLCQRRFDRWLYQGGWAKQQKNEQWQEFKIAMEDCVNTASPKSTFERSAQ